VLLTKKLVEHDAYRDSFRQFAIEHSSLSDRVRFTYVYEDTQSPFVKSVTWGRGAVNDTLGSLKVCPQCYETPLRIISHEKNV